MRVTAATISRVSVAPKLLESSGGLSDSRHFVDETAIVKSAKLVAESTAVASMTFDLLFLLAVGVYLIVLFNILVIIIRGLDDLLSLV